MLRERELRRTPRQQGPHQPQAAGPRRHGSKIKTLTQQARADHLEGDVGGRGVEVVTSSHDSADQVRYAEAALEFGLLASRGSDFHAPGESRTELGSLPMLGGRLRPVWAELGHRIHRA